MNRKILFVMLFFFFVFSVFCQNAGQTNNGFFYWEENGGITITKYKGSVKDVVIPEKIKNIPVVAIFNRAFADNQLTSVVIPNSVETIGGYAFYMNQLTSIVIGNSVKTIGDLAFAGNQLTSIVIPNSVKTIGESAFRGNQLTSIVIPNSVKTIGDLAFAGNQLTSVNIPNSGVSISDNAFADNHSETPFSVMIYRNTITIIGYNREERNVVIPEKINNLPVETIGYRVFAGRYLTSIVIPNSVKNIGYAAFAENELTSVVIPNSVETIGDYAFALNQLTSVVVPNSVVSISDNAFALNIVKGDENTFSIMIYKNTITIIGYNRKERNVVIPEPFPKPHEITKNARA